MTYARRTDRASRVHRSRERNRVTRPSARRGGGRTHRRAAAVGWPRSADAYDNPELMGGIHKAAQGGEAGDAAARAARAAGNAETGGVARFALIVGVKPRGRPGVAPAALRRRRCRALQRAVRCAGRARSPSDSRRREHPSHLGRRDPQRAAAGAGRAGARRRRAGARGCDGARAWPPRRLLFRLRRPRQRQRQRPPTWRWRISGWTPVEIERQIVDRVHANETHLIIDACYSYSLAYGRGTGGIRRPIGPFAATEGLARRPDVGLLLSTTSAQESHEWSNFQAGIFSHEVRSGLYGAADVDGDGQVSYLEIASFISRANDAIPNERYRPNVFAHAPTRGQSARRSAAGPRPPVEDRGGSGVRTIGSRICCGVPTGRLPLPARPTAVAGRSGRRPAPLSSSRRRWTAAGDSRRRRGGQHGRAGAARARVMGCRTPARPSTPSISFSRCPSTRRRWPATSAGRKRPRRSRLATELASPLTASALRRPAASSQGRAAISAALSARE